MTQDSARLATLELRLQRAFEVFLAGGLEVGARRLADGALQPRDQFSLFVTQGGVCDQVGVEAPLGARPHQVGQQVARVQLRRGRQERGGGDGAAGFGHGAFSALGQRMLGAELAA